MNTDQIREKPEVRTKGAPRVLVVDDDERIRTLLVDTLSALGYNSLGVKNGEEALSLLETEKLDLVITDVRMPKVNGLSLLRNVKARYPLVPVLIITGYDFGHSKDQAMEGGADGFLAKPFRIGKIEELIQKALGIKATPSGEKPYRLKKILVVDDDHELRNMLLEVLGSLDYFSIGVEDGEKALNQLKIQDFDLVISDIRMPNVDGLTLLKSIKDTIPELPVIMITGFPSSCPVQKAMQEGADGYLAKPFRIEKIDQLMRDLLYGEGESRPTAG
ncbi:MAG: response regulator [Candidatus Zixiibacteriota bacterium]